MKLAALIISIIALGIFAGVASAGWITGKVPGVFTRSAYDGTLDSAHLKGYIKTPARYVWCGWAKDKVVIHVRMTNKSAEHVTVNWYPRYSIKRGGIHGDGFSSAQSNGFDPGETRNLFIKQEPQGVKTGSAIAWCRPHFQMIESG